MGTAGDARPAARLIDDDVEAARQGILGGAVPENILLFVCAGGEEVLAGSVLYLSTNVCHV